MRANRRRTRPFSFAPAFLFERRVRDSGRSEYMMEATSLESGLAATTNTAPAVPSEPVAPASSPAPTSMSDALKQAGIGVEDAPEPDPTAPPAVPTTAAPVPDPTTVETPVPGEPPKEKWDTILGNARTKEREAVTQEFQQQHKEALSFAQAFEADPVGIAVQLVSMLQADPQHGPALRSHAGRMLAQQRGQPRPPQQPVEEPEPQADVEVEYKDGSRGTAYSAEQQAKRDAWNAKRLVQQIDAKYAPLQEMHQQYQKSQERQQQSQQAAASAHSAFGAWADQPHFKENLQAIAKEQQALFEKGITDPSVSVGKAYLTVLHRDVLPRLQAQSQEQLAATAMAKAAGRGDNPAAVVGSPPPAPKSMADALRQFGVT